MLAVRLPAAVVRRRSQEFYELCELWVEYAFEMVRSSRECPFGWWGFRELNAR